VCDMQEQGVSKGRREHMCKKATSRARYVVYACNLSYMEGRSRKIKI
jgi:hypothetical protein